MANFDADVHAKEAVALHPQWSSAGHKEVRQIAYKAKLVATTVARVLALFQPRQGHGSSGGSAPIDMDVAELKKLAADFSELSQMLASPTTASGEAASQRPHNGRFTQPTPPACSGAAGG